jgi:predicted DCC family thiol-disulfide oxidoreductase YuxK
MNMSASRKIVLFDGYCNLCNKSVQFILERERQSDLYFASLQSDFGKDLLKAHGYPEDYVDSVLFFDGKKLFGHSRAALKIAKHLKFPWSIVRVFWLVPNFLRDIVYRNVAKNRLRWFGKTESCWVMTPEYKARFLN